jgi:hypothetical protein
MTRSQQCLCSLGCLALAALAGVGACGGKDGKPSEPLPCASGALLHVQLSRTVASMTAPTFSICRNDTCYPWAPAPLSKLDDGTMLQPITNKAQIFGTFWLYSDGSVTIEIEWRVIDESDLHDGDHYVITLANGSGAPATVLDGIATYARTTSTGLDSGVACVEAKLSA